MATSRKTANQKTTHKSSGKGGNAGSDSAQAQAQAQAERLSRSLSESAQQIWLAGVGAFGRAQVEGTRLFEGLVKEGVGLEQTARKFAGGQAEVMRGAVQSGVGIARGRAVDTWDRLEKVFEDRVHRALIQIGVPDRDDLADLSRRIDTLNAQLRKHDGGKTTAAKPSRPAKKTTTRKPVAKKASRPAAKKVARPATAKKSGAKKSARSSIARPKPPAAP